MTEIHYVHNPHERTGAKLCTLIQEYFQIIARASHSLVSLLSSYGRVPGNPTENTFNLLPEKQKKFSEQ